MQASDFHRLAIEMAALSKAEKRKVGAVAVSAPDEQNRQKYATATNYHPDDKPCELEDGSTDPAVVHAEVSALTEFRSAHKKEPHTLYVTQPPCGACAKALSDINCHIIVVEEFMKFDTNKLRYDLVPVSAIEGLAKVITFGARKYKPDNWRKGSVDRYEAAAMRHLMAWRKGEKLDPDSGLLHLEHLLCNISFLIELDNQKSD